MNSRSSIVALSVALVSSAFWGCGQLTNPAAPAAETLSPSVNGSVTASSMPKAVFQTVPPIVDGTITGPSPLTVQFNLCQSRPANEDDNLRYTFDFDGNGQIDFYGHCRTERTYENPNGATACQTARLCVSDRRPNGEACQTVEICVESAVVEEQPEVAPEPAPEEPPPAPAAD